MPDKDIECSTGGQDSGYAISVVIVNPLIDMDSLADRIADALCGIDHGDEPCPVGSWSMGSRKITFEHDGEVVDASAYLDCHPHTVSHFGKRGSAPQAPADDGRSV